MALTKYDIWQLAVDRAKQELAFAESELNNAETDFVLAAAEAVIAKREKLNAVIRRAKRELTA